MASQMDDAKNMSMAFLGVYGLLTLWNLWPNGRHALFYNFWEGKIIRPRRSMERRASDLTSLLALLAQGAIAPQIAARVPLAEAGRAMTIAESKTVYGKIVIVP
jgi:NADPH2:quinone reductase